MKRIILGISTVGVRKDRLEESLAEAAELGLTEVALFLTGIRQNQRAAAFELIGKYLKGNSIRAPFVHALTDMKEDEFRWLQGEVGTEAFNLHTQREWPFIYPYSDDLKKIIYIENLGGGLRPEDVEGFGGICLDLSHLENYHYRQHVPDYEGIEEVLGSFPIRANHISAIYDSPRPDPDTGKQDFAWHYADDLDNVDYLKRFPEEYYGPMVTVELQNSLIEQIALARRMKAITGIRIGSGIEAAVPAG